MAGRNRACASWSKIFTALTDPAGVTAHRPGALERVALLLADWHDAHRRLADTETRMTAVLDELNLTELVTSITGISPVGAAAILAQTGDPPRFATARALVKHAGLAPREKLSGTFTGRTKFTGQGRPGLRLAAWRTVWGAQRANPVYAARYRHLTARDHNKLRPTQAQTVIAAAILRHLHAVITTGQSLGPRHRHPRHPTRARTSSRRLTSRRRPRTPSWRSGRAPRGIETPGDLDAHHGQPRPSSHQPDYTLPGPTPFSYAGTDDGRGTDRSLTQNDSR